MATCPRDGAVDGQDFSNDTLPPRMYAEWRLVKFIQPKRSHRIKIIRPRVTPPAPGIPLEPPPPEPPPEDCEVCDDIDYDYDSFECYMDGIVDGLPLDEGCEWPFAYVVRVNYLGVVAHDDIESYNEGVNLNGRNGGWGFAAPYVSRTGYLGLQAKDDMEDYTNGAGVNGLNEGTGWNAAYTDH